MLYLDNILKRNGKRAVALLLAVAMLSSNLSSIAYAADGFEPEEERVENLFEFSGAGTEEDPYILMGKTGLEQLAYNMELEDYYTVGKYFKVKSEITQRAMLYARSLSVDAEGNAADTEEIIDDVNNELDEELFNQYEKDPVVIENPEDNTDEFFENAIKTKTSNSETERLTEEDDKNESINSETEDVTKSEISDTTNAIEGKQEEKQVLIYIVCC